MNKIVMNKIYLDIGIVKYKHESNNTKVYKQYEYKCSYEKTYNIK